MKSIFDNGGIIGKSLTYPGTGTWSINRSYEYQLGNLWKNQRTITITSTTTSNLQVRILLTTSNFNYSKCRSDGGDIRFVANANDDPASSALTYWLETWNNIGNSVFWVKVPTTSTTTLYMKYNAFSRTLLSDIDNTMEAGLRYRYFAAGGTAPTVPNANVDGGGTDTDINDSWGSGTVSVAGFGTRADSVAVIWDGWVKNSGSGNHIFYGTSDDGQRLYINGNLVINQWIDRGATEDSYTYGWTDGTPKTIRYDWYENGGGADAKLGWTPPSTGVKVYPIPSTSLRSPKYSSSYGDPYTYAATIGAES